MSVAFPCRDCGEMPTVFTVQDFGVPKVWGLECENPKCPGEHYACGWTKKDAIKHWNAHVTGAPNYDWEKK